MKIEEFRAEVQKALKNDRGVTDVAFEPQPNGIERVYFYDAGVRANFLLAPDKIKDKQTLALAVKASAQSAHDAAVKQAAEEAARAAAEAAALVDEAQA